jgi:hypothetical protein
MAKLSMSQIAQVALNAGLPENKVATAVAIAMAESGGNTQAHNRVPPDNSYGLWQINMLGDLGPARRKQFGLSGNDDLFSPAVNAKAMVAISGNGSNWRPWTTYTGGAFLAFLPSARKAVGETTASGSIPIDLPSETGGAFDNIRRVFRTVTDAGEWRRYGLFLGGSVLCGIALVKFSGTGGAVAKAAKVLNPVRKVAKVVKK